MALPLKVKLADDGEFWIPEGVPADFEEGLAPCPPLVGRVWVAYGGKMQLGQIALGADGIFITVVMDVPDAKGGGTFTCYKLCPLTLKDAKKLANSISQYLPEVWLQFTGFTEWVKSDYD